MMTGIGAFITGIAALAVPTTDLARTKACMTEQEAAALFSYALPEVIETVTKKCTASLPAASFLAPRGSQLAASYRQISVAHWPLAKSAFFKTLAEDDGDADEILAGMPDDALKGLMGSALGVVIGKDIKAENCPRIDSIVSALAPLPPSNVSSLLVQLIAMAGDTKDNPFKLCPTS